MIRRAIRFLLAVIAVECIALGVIVCGRIIDGDLPRLSGAALIGAPLLLAAGVACLALVVRMDEEGS